MLFAVRFLGIATFYFSSLSFAGTEYLPLAETPAEKQEQVEMIRRLLPFSNHNSTVMIDTQNAGLEALRKKFPDFEKWAAAKPDPITITIERKELANELSYVLQKDRFEALQKAIYSQLDGTVESMKKAGESVTMQSVRNRTLQQIGQNLLGGANSLRGLITGVLQILPADQKAAIFKIGDPMLQYKALRELKIADANLQNGNFQAERFGLNSKTVTLAEIYGAIEKKLNTHQEFLEQLGVFAVLNRATEKDLAELKGKESKATQDRLLNPSDFRFLESGEGAFVVALEAGLNQVFAKSEAKIKKSLEQTIAAVPKQWFERREIPIEITKPLIKVVEVHPYLGIYRGCIGPDCSTSSSPMYPFSPWEHDFYIVDPTGKIIGYISATRVETNGQSALYLKDMIGLALSPDVAEVIMHAFQTAIPHFGVQRYLIANPGFTNSQNRNGALTQRYARYNGYAAKLDGTRAETVPVTFPDSEVRVFIQSTPVFRSGAGYDNPYSHTTGAVFTPQIDMSRYKVSYAPGTLSAFKPQTPKESLLLALRMLVADENAKIGEIPGLVESEVRSVLRMLKNPEFLDLAPYYKRVGVVFERYGIELSRSFRQQQEHLFVEGHIRASDAFRTADESMRVDSEKFFVNYCRRTKDFLTMGLLATRWSDFFNQSKRVTDLVNLYGNRAEEADIVSLLLFASAGNKVANQWLKSEKVQPRIESVLQQFLFAKDMKEVAGELPPLFALRKIVRNPSQNSAENLERMIRQSLGAMDLNFDKLSSAELSRGLNLAVVQATQAFVGENGPRRLRFYVQEFEKGHVTVTDFMVSLLSFEYQKTDLPLARAVIQERLKSLRTAPRDDEVRALEALIWMQVEGVQVDAAVQSHFAPAMLNFLKVQLSGGQRSPEVNELINALNGKGFQAIGSQLNEKLKAFLLLMNSKQKELPPTLPGFYQALQEILTYFRLDIPTLFSDVQLKRKVANIHVRYPEAYDVKQAEAFGRSMAWATEFVLAGEEFERPVGLMIANLKNLRDTPQYQKFVQTVVEASQRKSSPAVYRVLLQLIAVGGVPENTKLNVESLQELLRMDDSFVKTYAASELLKMDSKLQLTAEDLRSISQMLANSDEGKLPDVLLAYSEKAMDILLSVRSNDERVQKEIRETVKEDDSLRMVLKAAIAYIKNGGSVADMKKYVGHAFEDHEEDMAKKWQKKNPNEVFPGVRYDSKINFWRSYFNAVEKDPAVVMNPDKASEIKSSGQCKLIFLRVKQGVRVLKATGS